jgi:probable RNA-binding protein EIF1AD
MRRSKKAAVAEETSIPPSVLTPTQLIAQVIKSDGKSVWTCIRPDGRNILVELPSRFHNTIWLRRGIFVLIDSKDYEVRDNKLDGQITNVVRDERHWKKQPYW